VPSPSWGLSTRSYAHHSSRVNFWVCSRKGDKPGRPSRERLHPQGWVRRPPGTMYVYAHEAGNGDRRAADVLARVHGRSMNLSAPSSLLGRVHPLSQTGSAHYHSPPMFSVQAIPGVPAAELSVVECTQAPPPRAPGYGAAGFKVRVEFADVQARQDGLQTLLQTVEAIERILRTHRNDLVGAYREQVTGYELTKCLIFRQFEELATILRMTYKGMQSFRLELWGLARNSSSLVEIVATEEEIKINIQVIYEWLYHLCELITNAKGGQVRSLVSKSIWQRVKFHCKFRNYLVTHVGGTELFPPKGLPFAADFDSCWLEAHTHFPSEDAFKRLEDLLATLLGMQASMERDLMAFAAGCRQLFDAINERPSDLRQPLSGSRTMADLDYFIKHYGAVSASPLALAGDIRDLATELLPRLRASTDVTTSEG